MEGSHPLCHHRYSLHCPCADNANFSNGYTKFDGNEVKEGGMKEYLKSIKQ